MKPKQINIILGIVVVALLAVVAYLTLGNRS